MKSLKVHNGESREGSLEVVALVVRCYHLCEQLELDMSVSPSSDACHPDKDKGFPT